MMVFVNRDEALFWLNDRCGDNVVVGVRVDFRDDAVLVLSAEGELNHWRAGPSHGFGADDPEEIMGLYAVGDDVLLDVTQLTGCVISADGEHLTLYVGGADDVSLTVVRPAFGRAPMNP
jgi:hypothetical protein